MKSPCCTAARDHPGALASSSCRCTHAHGHDSEARNERLIHCFAKPAEPTVTLEQRLSSLYTSMCASTRSKITQPADVVRFCFSIQYPLSTDLCTRKQVKHSSMLTRERTSQRLGGLQSLSIEDCGVGSCCKPLQCCCWLSSSNHLDPGKLLFFLTRRLRSPFCFEIRLRYQLFAFERCVRAG